MSCFHLSHPSVHWRPLCWTPTQICSKAYFRIMLPCWPELSNVVATVFRVNVKPAQFYFLLLNNCQSSRSMGSTGHVRHVQSEWGGVVLPSLVTGMSVTLVPVYNSQKKTPCQSCGKGFSPGCDHSRWVWMTVTSQCAFVSVAPRAKPWRGKLGVRGVGF